MAYSCRSESVIFMTQTQSRTPQKLNSFAALDKKVANAIAADTAATQPQRQILRVLDHQVQTAPQQQSAASAVTSAAKILTGAG